MVATRNDPGRGAELEAAGELLREVARLHVRAQRERVACCGTSVAQCHVLTELARAGPLPVTELGRRLGLHKGWISRAVASLVDDGLLERGARDADARVVIVSLTPAGGRRVAALNGTLNRQAAAVLRRVAGPELEHVRRALALVRTALREELGLAGGAAEGRRLAGGERT